jgi:hypothetical protein
LAATATTDGFEPDRNDQTLKANIEVPAPQAAGLSALELLKVPADNLRKPTRIRL